MTRVYGQGTLKVPQLSDIKQTRFKSRLDEGSENDYDDLMVGSEKMKQAYITQLNRTINDSQMIESIYN